MSEWVNKVRQLYDTVTHTRIYSSDDDPYDESRNWPGLGWYPDYKGGTDLLVHHKGKNDDKQWATQYTTPRCTDCGSGDVRYDESSQPVCQACGCLVGGAQLVIDLQAAQQMDDGADNYEN